MTKLVGGTDKRGVSRRSLLKGAGTAALLAAAKTAFPGGANVAWAAGPEVKGTKLGYIALTDASPLIIAKEKGFFAKYGLPDMEILKQASWGATRDNMALGSKANGIDGGHILRPKVHLYTTGKVMQNNQPLPMYTLLHLNEDCQGLSVSNEYKDLKVGTDSSALKEAFAKKKAAGKEVKAAMTFPGGTHDLWIRYWLAAGGIDPDKDISTIVVPPPQMVANMKVGNMDASASASRGTSSSSTRTSASRPPPPARSGSSILKRCSACAPIGSTPIPGAAQAIMMAVMEAQNWCDKMENKQEMAEIIGKRQWFNVPVADIIGRIKGDINYGRGRVEKGTKLRMKFWGEGGAVSYPWKSLDAWFVTENIRWGKFAPRSTSRRSSPRPTARTSGSRPPRRSVWRTPSYRRSAAASRNSSTARCSIPPIRRPT